jgi:hypothetical protein
MVKALGILLGGMFVGAVGTEVLRRKYPGCMDKLSAKVKQATSAAKQAFKEGYRSVAESPETA